MVMDPDEDGVLRVLLAVDVVSSSSSSNPGRAQEEIIRLGITSATKNFPNNLLSFIGF